MALEIHTFLGFPIATPFFWEAVVHEVMDRNEVGGVISYEYPGSYYMLGFRLIETFGEKNLSGKLRALRARTAGYKPFTITVPQPLNTGLTGTPNILLSQGGVRGADTLSVKGIGADQLLGDFGYGRVLNFQGDPKAYEVKDVMSGNRIGIWPALRVAQAANNTVNPNATMRVIRSPSSRSLMRLEDRNGVEVHPDVVLEEYIRSNA